MGSKRLSSNILKKDTSTTGVRKLIRKEVKDTLNILGNTKNPTNIIQFSSGKGSFGNPTTKTAIITGVLDTNSIDLEVDEGILSANLRLSSNAVSAGNIAITNTIESTGVKGLRSALAYNTTNLKITSGALDTIQGISTAASPQFVGLTLSGLTQGSVIFAGASGVISQSNSLFFWDSTNGTLGVGGTRSGAISATNSRLRVVGSGNTSSTSSLGVLNSDSTAVFRILDNAQTFAGVGTFTPPNTKSYFNVVGSSEVDGTNPVTLTIADLTNSQSWTVNAEMSRLDFYSADNSGLGAGTRCRIAMLTQSTSANHTALDFYTGGATLGRVMRMHNNQRITIGTTTVTSQSKLTLEGEDTTTGICFTCQGLGAGTTAFQLRNDGVTGFGAAINANRRFLFAGNHSAPSWTTNGVGIVVSAATYTNTNTASSGTASTGHIHVIGQPTIAATNSVVTVTDAATVYIAGAPANVTDNTVITRPWALAVNAGNTFLGGKLVVGNTIASNYNTSTSIAGFYATSSPILTIGLNNTTVSSGNVIGRINFWNNDTQLTTQQIYAGIEVQAAQNITTDAAAGRMLFYTTSTSAGGSPLEAVRISPAQRMAVGVGSDPTARLQVRSSTSDSSTTALLVENSSASPLISARSDGAIGINTTSALSGVVLNLSGGDLNLPSGNGIRVNNTATSGYALIGDGTRFIPTALTGSLITDINEVIDDRVADLLQAGTGITLTYNDPLNTLTVAISSSYAGQTSITTLGTISTGTWNATAIGPTKGGTGQTSWTTGDILYASATDTLSKLPAGTNGYVLSMSSGVPAWVSATNIGGNINGSGTANYLPKFSDSDTLTNSLIYDNGTSIGINTTSALSGVVLNLSGGDLNLPSGNGIRVNNTATSGYALIGDGTRFIPTALTGSLITDINEVIDDRVADLLQAGTGITLTYNDPLNTLTVAISSSYAGQTSITTLGTISTGTWNATAIGPTKGGTGQTSWTTGDILYASATDTLSKLPAGTNGYVLSMSSGVPAWVSATNIGGNINGSGTANYLPKFSDSDTLTNSLIYDNGTSIGIGTTSPGDRIHLTTGSVRLNGLTASRAVVTDANKSLASSSVTSTELGYLSGVTSAIQTQINSRAVISPTPQANQVAYWTNGTTIAGSNNLLFDGSCLQVKCLKYIDSGWTEIPWGSNPVPNGFYLKNRDFGWGLSGSTVKMYTYSPVNGGGFTQITSTLPITWARINTAGEYAPNPGDSGTRVYIAGRNSSNVAKLLTSSTYHGTYTDNTPTLASSSNEQNGWFVELGGFHYFITGGHDSTGDHVRCYKRIASSTAAWSSATNVNSGSGYSMIHDVFTAGGEIYVAVGETPPLAAEDTKIYKSSNGTSWSLVHTIAASPYKGSFGTYTLGFAVLHFGYAVSNQLLKLDGTPELVTIAGISSSNTNVNSFSHNLISTAFGSESRVHLIDSSAPDFVEIEATGQTGTVSSNSSIFSGYRSGGAIVAIH